MDEHDDTTMPDTVFLGGGSKKEAESEEPWGGVGDDSQDDNWGEGNDLDPGSEDSWGQGQTEGQAFTPDPGMFAGMDDGGEATPAKFRFSINKKWIMIPAAAAIILAVGMVSFFMITGSVDAPAEKGSKTSGQTMATAPAEAPVKAPAVSGPAVDNYQGARNVRLELEPFIIPYGDTAKKTFLFLRVALEIDENETYALLEANKPLLRGVIYDTVLEEMERAGDKDAFNGNLENVLAAKLKSVFATMGIHKVHFTNHYSV